ncbi:alpha/beta hydrolase [Gaoshiqia sediminis]|uniref:AB hydrolase-1 domain-containing protein n=1 Tax=Gaoshiqia sediminis TaxID=2986998 RepID=A0AA41Y501_9BACT|nr:alpha/beta fold hydrolase [Gaoshiqia sediminis]MCW0483561.1 hypothetical protein [Gaoshiqia sediminis]
MKKELRILLVVFLFLQFVYWAGPKPSKPTFDHSLPEIEVALEDIDRFIATREAELPVKPNNESRIFWNDDHLKSKTAFCLLYLHGFSASGFEGQPTHINVAKHFAANAYIPRLAAHGLEGTEPLLNMTPDTLYKSAKEALQIARLLGEKVIIMSTSTGGTLSLKLAADFPELVDGLMLLSPNIAINNPAAFLLSKPWGLQIARRVYDGKYRYVNENPDDVECQYWNCHYRLEATVYLQQLIEKTMTKRLFNRVETPTFLAYYYQDNNHQDHVVRVDAMLKMFEQLGTPDSLKRKQAFDAGTHVIGCELYSKCQPQVEQTCIRFAETVLRLKPN